MQRQPLLYVDTENGQNKAVCATAKFYPESISIDNPQETAYHKIARGRHNGRNRLEEAEVRDTASGNRTVIRYGYDALGRRTLAQEEGSEVLRTLYDGRSFEVIREGPSYRDGQLTTRSASGPVQASGQNGGTAGNGVVNNGAAPSNTPTGERYRWLSEGQEGRTRSTASRTTTGQTARYEGISVTLYGNGKAVGLSRSASAGTRGGAVGRTVVGAVYLGTDILGSVRSSTNELGVLEDRYEYDAFGTPYKGDLESGMNRGYTGKPYDSATGLYNYGYRDYEPATTRFTTTDPVRDGTNWFAYVNKDPVNWVDPWGLSGSDRGSNGGQDEVQYIAQTVQYNLNPVYYYEETVKSEITVYGLNRQSYTYNQDFHYTYYSDDKMAITQHRDDKMDPLKNNPVIIQNPKNEREFLDSTQNKYRRIDVTITYGQIYKSELPTNRPMPQNGRVIRVNNTASASGFKPQGQ